MNIQQYIDRGISYPDYKQLLDKLFAEGKTTGHNQSAELVEYAKVNLQRMHRLEKTTEVLRELTTALCDLKGNYVWLLITEGWCGDAAQNVPVFEHIVKTCNRIELKLVLRDDNPELIDQYLTNGSRSVPKLICIDKDSLKEIFVWGPRPATLQNMVADLVKQGMPKDERGLLIQKWYNADKTLTLQTEVLALVKKHLV